MKVDSILPKVPNRMLLCVISNPSFFFGEGLPFFKGFNRRNLNPADREVTIPPQIVLRTICEDSSHV